MKKDYRELYEKITKSDWFKKAYQDKSLGVCPIVIEELEESEDERIRSCICLALTDVDEQRFTDFGVTLKDCLAYLEKRKEQEPVSVVRIPKFRVGDIIQHVPLEKWDRSVRVSAIDENGYSIDCTHIGDTVSGGYIGFSFENEYELVERKPAEWSEEDEQICTGKICIKKRRLD